MCLFKAGIFQLNYFFRESNYLLLKDIYYCPIEIIKGLTDKGQFQYL